MRTWAEEEIAGGMGVPINVMILFILRDGGTWYRKEMPSVATLNLGVTDGCRIFMFSDNIPAEWIDGLWKPVDHLNPNRYVEIPR